MKASKYETQAEVEFIKGLGKWAPENPGASAMTRLQLLKNYRTGALKRSDWAEIDRAQALKTCAAQIDRLDV